MIHLTRTVQVADRCLLCCLFCLTRLVALTQSLSTKLFEHISRILHAPSCKVFPTPESAVVIVGGDDDLGRTLALSFSEAGYTVFALYQVKSDVLQVAEVADTSSAPSANLLYVWHKQKERSGHPGWGLVAPIVLDTQSGAQRTRASETIYAYCENHSLHLVSLVILSPHPETPPCNEVASPRDQSLENITSKRRSDRDLTEALMWGDTVSQSIKGPLLLVQDYVEMLTEASGRVIVISTCPEHCSLAFQFCPPLNGVADLITQYLSQKLKHYGIKVCSVSIGPVGTSNMPEEPTAVHSPKFPRSQESRRSASAVRRLARRLLESYAISRNDVSSLILNIVAARYPKTTYSIGLYPVFYHIAHALPEFLQQLAI